MDLLNGIHYVILNNLGSLNFYIFNYVLAKKQNWSPKSYFGEQIKKVY